MDNINIRRIFDILKGTDVKGDIYISNGERLKGVKIADVNDHVVKVRTDYTQYTIPLGKVDVITHPWEHGESSTYSSGSNSSETCTFSGSNNSSPKFGSTEHLARMAKEAKASGQENGKEPRPFGSALEGLYLT